MELIYGTYNPSKLSSMKRRLEGLNITLIGLDEIDFKLTEPEESGRKPADNAMIKAMSYYKQLKRPVMSADSGLYFDGVEEEDQPGCLIKRIQGRDMNYDDLIGFYSNLAKKYGGKLLAHYKNAVCLVLDEEHVFLLEGKEAESEPFYMVDKPHEKYADGFPLDSLSVEVKSMKYYYDIEDLEDKVERTTFDKSMRAFMEKNMRPNELKIRELLNLNETIAASIFEGLTYPWEVLAKISEYIIELGASLSEAEYRKVGRDVWISNSAMVAQTSSITGPAIIGHHADIRHCAFIRGNVVIGNNNVIGNSTEIKNSILFNNVQVPHYNYVGDSILGYKSHMGAGAITSNVKSDKSLISVKIGHESIETGLRKFGAILGDGVDVGSNSVLNPGSVVGRGSHIYPLSMVRGYIPENCIYKKQGEIVVKY